MEFFGLLTSVIVGAIIGLLGGGGSVMTIPLLVYLFGLAPVDATTYSLLIVGVVSAIGSFKAYHKKNIDFDVVLRFGIPSIVGVILSRRFLLNYIPDNISLFKLSISKDSLLLILFSILLLISSFQMISKKRIKYEKTKGFYKVVGSGFFVGSVTGLLGAGGGFLIIPFLVNVFRIPIKLAIGTSLAIITINSLLGFSITNFSKQSFDWSLLLKVTSLALLGLFMGQHLASRIDGLRLKIIFGWFILIVGSAIIISNLI